MGDAAPRCRERAPACAVALPRRFVNLARCSDRSRSVGETKAELATDGAPICTDEKRPEINSFFINRCHRCLSVANFFFWLEAPRFGEKASGDGAIEGRNVSAPGATFVPHPLDRRSAPLYSRFPRIRNDRQAGGVRRVERSSGGLVTGSV